MDVSLKELAAILHLSERRVRQLRDEQGILTPEPGIGGSTSISKSRELLRAATRLFGKKNRRNMSRSRKRFPR